MLSARSIEEPEQVPTGSSSPPYESWDGEFTFRGRAVDEDGAGIPGVKVEAFPWARYQIGPPQRTTSSAEDGAFHVERVGPWFRLRLHHSDFATVDYSLEVSDLDPDRPPVEILMPSPASAATLEVGVVGSERLIAQGLSIEAHAARFTMETGQAFHSLASAGRPKTDLGPDGTGTLFPIPPGVMLRLICKSGGATVTEVLVDSLEPREVRKVEIDVGDPIRLSIRFVEGDTGQEAQWSPPDYWSELDLDLVPEGSEEAIPLLANAPLITLARDVMVPVPGLVRLNCRGRGFDPVSREALVQSDAELTVELNRRRVVEVDLLDSEGEPLVFAMDDYLTLGAGVKLVSGTGRWLMPSISVQSYPFNAQVPECRGSTSDPNRGKWGPQVGRETVDRSRARVLVPSDGGHIAAYWGSEVVGTVPVGPEQDRVRLVTRIPEATAGTLVTPVVDSESGEPAASFGVLLEPFQEDRGTYWGTWNFRVHRSEDGIFRLERLMCGTYRLSVTDPDTGDPQAWTVVEIHPDEITDSDTLYVAKIATLHVAVVDSNRQPVAHPEIRVYHDEMMDFTHFPGGSGVDSQWIRGRANGAASLKCRIGSVRVEARAPGFAPGATSLFFQEEGNAGCAVVLHPGREVTPDPELLDLLSEWSEALEVRIVDAGNRCEYFAGCLMEETKLLVPPEARCRIIVRTATEDRQLGQVVEQGGVLVLR